MLQGEKIDPKELDAILRNLRAARRRSRLQGRRGAGAPAGVGDRQRQAPRIRSAAQGRGDRGQLLLRVPTRCPRSSASSSSSTTGRCRRRPKRRKRGEREAAGQEAVRTPQGTSEMRRIITAGLVALTLAVVCLRRTTFSSSAGSGGAEARDRRELRRLVHLLPVVLHAASAASMAARGGGPTTRPPIPTSDPSQRADQDAGQPAIPTASTESSRRPRSLDGKLFQCPLSSSRTRARRRFSDGGRRLRAYLLKGGFSGRTTSGARWRSRASRRELARVLPPGTDYSVSGISRPITRSSG